MKKVLVLIGVLASLGGFSFGDSQFRNNFYFSAGAESGVALPKYQLEFRPVSDFPAYGFASLSTLMGVANSASVGVGAQSSNYLLEANYSGMALLGPMNGNNRDPGYYYNTSINIKVGARVFDMYSTDVINFFFYRLAGQNQIWSNLDVKVGYSFILSEIAHRFDFNSTIWRRLTWEIGWSFFSKT